MIKKLLGLLLLFLICYLGYHYKSVIYGMQQASGQLQLIWQAEEIEDLKQDPSFPDSVKAKFEYIQEVKTFAQEHLGLEKSKNYTTYFDQKGKPILWVVTASPEFKIEAYQWEFPIAGSFSYKGFFDLELAKQEAKKMKALGYDTEIDEVNAWSTLGWLRDPILSSMLKRSEGRLAELIIHELTHATIYLKNEIEFNENLATFVGRKGAEQFLIEKFGEDSEELFDYQDNLRKKAFFKEFIYNAKSRLDSLYQSFDNSISIEETRSLKQATINSIKEDLLLSEYYSDKQKGRERLKNFKPNNAYFSGISTYHSRQDDLSKQLKQEFNGNLKAMIQSFKD